MQILGHAARQSDEIRGRLNQAAEGNSTIKGWVLAHIASPPGVQASVPESDPPVEQNEMPSLAQKIAQARRCESAKPSMHSLLSPNLATLDSGYASASSDPACPGSVPIAVPHAQMSMQDPSPSQQRYASAFSDPAYPGSVPIAVPHAQRSTQDPCPSQQSSSQSSMRDQLNLETGNTGVAQFIGSTHDSIHSVSKESNPASETCHDDLNNATNATNEPAAQIEFPFPLDNDINGPHDPVHMHFRTRSDSLVAPTHHSPMPLRPQSHHQENSEVSSTANIPQHDTDHQTLFSPSNLANMISLSYSRYGVKLREAPQSNTPDRIDERHGSHDRMDQST